MSTDPFILPELPPAINYLDLIQDIAKAQNTVGQLNGILTNLSNPFLIMTPLLTKEAVLSSRIEGTQASLEDVYKYEAAQKNTEKDETEKDIREIINYRAAMNAAMKELQKKPIGENLIKKIHDTLLSSVRGSNKDRGSFRRIQVYIGRPGAGIEEARYIPPPVNEIPHLINNWEKYINSDQEKDLLVQIGVGHYQFEAIHPFLDGNGRIGRLLIPLLLFQKRFLSYPLLYISEYFEENRSDYYDLLNNVSRKNDWLSWIRFFLTAVTNQAEKTQKLIKDILSLYERMKREIVAVNSIYAVNLLDILFETPYVSYKSIKDRLRPKAIQTLYNLLSKFQQKGILSEISGDKRNKTYVFTELLEIIK